jgi:hypothetical protein
MSENASSQGSLPSQALASMPPPPTADAVNERLTHYSVYTIRKVAPQDPREKATWARAEITEDRLYQDNITQQIQKLNDSDVEHGRTLQSKKAALFPFQKGQVQCLLDDLSSAELDVNFEWTLVQIDRKERDIGNGMRETETMTVFVKRSIVQDVDPAAVYEALQNHVGDLKTSAMHITGRRNSLHISDVAPVLESTSPRPSTEEDCRKALTSHYIAVVSTTIKKGQLSFDLTKLQIEHEKLVTREKMKSTLHEISIRTRHHFSLDYRRKPLNSIEELLILSFLNHRRQGEKDESFEWAIVKAFKHHQQDNDQRQDNNQAQAEPD